MYPSATQTLAGQLTAKHLTWKAYLEGMDEGAGRRRSRARTAAIGACGHPALGARRPDLGADPARRAGLRDLAQPVRVLPFADRLPGCASDDVGLSTLKADLASVKSTPSFAYIVPGPLRRRQSDAVRAGQRPRG